MPHWSTQLDRLDLITILNLNDQFSQVSFEMLVVHVCGSGPAQIFTCICLRVRLATGSSTVTRLTLRYILLAGLHGDSHSHAAPP